MTTSDGERELASGNPRPQQPAESRRGFETAPKELAGLRAVVTGSSSGIGRAIALELAGAGADVLVHARPRSSDAAEQCAKECAERGVRTATVLADISSLEGCRELVENAWKAFPPVDIWVNNAGADLLTGPEGDLPYQEKLDLLWRVDVRGTIAISRDVGQRMHDRGAGALLNMGWDQAETGMEGESGELFAATKGAVMAFSRSLALSLAPVRVNCLAPGWIRTAWGRSASREWRERVERETPLDRWGEPEDVARLARFLVSPQAAFITGQTVRINGGAVR